jgi:transposase
MRFWRRNPEGGLEAELRSNRPEPSRELVNRIEARLRSHRERRAGSFRVAFAGALIVGLMAALASVGGVGYAATGVSDATEKAKRIMHVHGVTKLRKSAAIDQYRKPSAKPKAKPKRCAKGTKRVRGVCKKVRKARGVRFRRPPFTG